jgi:leucyl/phenylalanyl-tRNA--protein transferase
VKLSEAIRFPDPAHADENGLVAIGGDLQPDRLTAAYRQGIFPWSVNPITWWSPDPRGVIELAQFHISKSLAKTLRRGVFTLTIDQAFREVVEACAAPSPKRRGGWITAEFVAAYTRLHELGHAHSVECWLDGKLAGGIYGVTVGGLFAGESMFHRADNASKAALVHLVEHLRVRGYTLFDIQMVTEATKPLGAKWISREDYLERVAKAVAQDCVFGDSSC